MSAGSSLAADRKSGQKNLFAEVDEIVASPTSLPDVPALSDRDMRTAEKEVLGYYVHSHPLDEHRETLSAIVSQTVSDLAKLPARSEVCLGGLVSSLKLSNIKAPRAGSVNTRYAMFDLEDIEGVIRTICWPEEYASRWADRSRCDCHCIGND